MNRKKLMMILATTTIMVMLLVPMMATQLASAATYDPDNMVVDGVLSTDTYVLYPYDDEDLIIGFSKYGELINSEIKTGLEYDGMDVFANPNVLEKDWSQGWLLDIHYSDLSNTYKRAWAYALYADQSGVGGIGGPWREAVTNGPLGTPYGGRKTNVWATTDDIQVLYDGPRRFVAVTNTTIYDAATKTDDDALVSVTITFVFNKVKKIVILYKDIKRLDKGKFGRTFQVEFSNRGEWDIGTSSAPPSYAHFYDNLATEYDGEYHEFYNTTDPLGYDLAQMIDEDRDYVGFAAFWPPLYGKLVDGTTHITRSTILSSLCTKERNETWLGLGSPSDRQIDFPALGWLSSDPYPVGLGIVDDTPMVFKNNILLTEGVEYTWVGGSTDTITFGIEPEDTDRIVVVWKHETNPGSDDMISHAGHEPDVPYVIGEWCFDLENADHKRMFRAVTVYGLTDQHTADDNDRSGGTNVIDNEVMYLLDETFNPYDLKQAVHKDTRRWVYIKTLTTTTTSITLAEAPMVGWEVESSLPDWDQYCEFAERVLIDHELAVPYRAPQSSYDYTLSVSSTTGKGTITFSPSLPAGTHVKILYSTKPEWYDYNYQYLTDVTVNTQIAPAAQPAEVNAVVSESTTETAADPLGLQFNYTAYIDMYLTLDQTNNFTETIQFYMGNYDYDFKVLYDPNTDYDIYDDYLMLYGNLTEYMAGENITGTLSPYSTLYWSIEANKEATDIDYNYAAILLDVTATYENVTNWFNVTISPTIYRYYYAHQMGAYEWMVVGKDAKSIDSAGAAYITQAFDSKKQIHVKMTGLDIRESDFGPNAPYVMAGATTGTRTDYYYDYPTDMRSGLHDDWCTTNPVSSSNMLFTGGPRANLGTEYFNEFTMAMFAANEYVVTDIGHQDEIYAISCWDRDSYGSGYAAISVYKDLNGTIGFLIWGMDGQDTYYASKWFWDSGIYDLQDMNDGVTDIILKITYPSSDPIHPTFSIVERLGTISHKPQHDCPVEELPV